VRRGAGGGRGVGLEGREREGVGVGPGGLLAGAPTVRQGGQWGAGGRRGRAP